MIKCGECVRHDNCWLYDEHKNDNGTCVWAESKSVTEARGKWIPLGHQIGFLKHPWSEDYRCSLCGYEAYTIGTPPPKVCPQCHANNIIYKANDVIEERNEVIE